MMAFQRNFVVSILNHENKIVREEAGDYNRVARVAFDSEYKIRIQNKTRRRAYARVEIDGMEVSPGRRFVLGPKESVDLERFILDGDLSAGRRFKFMSLEKGAATGEIQDPTSLENGKIKVTFEPEIEPPSIKYSHNGGQSILRGRGMPQTYGASSGGNYPMMGTTQAFYTSSNQGSPGVDTGHVSTNNYVAPQGSDTLERAIEPQTVSELGATAEGSVSDQKFTDSHEFFFTETPVEIVIMLKGPKPLPKTDWTLRQKITGPEVIFKGMYLDGIKDAKLTKAGLVITIPEVNLE
jgi:hypothetical protein